MLNIKMRFIVILRIIKRDVINLRRSSCKVPFLQVLMIFTTDAEFHADRWRTDGQTDMTKLVVVFLSFADPPKNLTVNEINEYNLKEIFLEWILVHTGVLSRVRISVCVCVCVCVRVCLNLTYPSSRNCRWKERKSKQARCV